MNLLLLALGIGLLYLGGEILVAGATAIARRSGMSPMVIGLTVVAFATSCPELFATVAASLRGSPSLGLGNVLGSNIANVALILGLSALIRPLVAGSRFVRREVVMMIAVAVAPFLVLADGVIERVEGAVLIFLLMAYTFFLIRSERFDRRRARGAGATPAEAAHGQEEEEEEIKPWWWSLGAVTLGVGLLVAGAHFLVEGGVGIARSWGVSERVIGVTLVAFGTSLPELAASLVAARRRQGDIILGNIAGSNVFNVLCVLGVAAIIQPIPSQENIAPDLWAGLALAVALVPLLLIDPRHRLGRLEGSLLLLAYGGYITYLFF